MTIQLLLKGRVPSKKNSKRRIKRGNHIFMVPSQAHQDWHLIQMGQLSQSPYRGLKLNRVLAIDIEFWGADRRSADLSNKAESIMDLLVDAEILKDDNWFVVPTLLLKMNGVDKDNPRAKITITQ